MKAHTIVPPAGFDMPLSKWPVDLTRMRNQESFVLDIARFVLWIGGRGCAKTSSGVFKLLNYLVEWPGATAIIVGPTFPQLRATTMRAFFDWTPPEWILYKNLAGDQMFVDILVPDAEIPSRVYFRSNTNPDAIRGMWCSISWIDEAADCGEELFDILTPCHREPGYPYQTILTGTPRGYNWVYRRLVDSRARLGSRVSAYFARSQDNPYLPEDFVPDLIAQYGEGSQMFEQEVLGKFVTFQGMVFPNFNDETSIRPLPDDMKFKRVHGCTDFGLTDPSVILLIGEDPSGRYWAFKEFYQGRAQGSQFMALHAQWQAQEKVKRFWCDPHAKIEIATMRAAQIHVAKGNASIETGIRIINDLLVEKPGGPGLIITPDCPNLIREMLAYSHTPQTRGLDAEMYGKSFSDTISKKQSDHAVDALRYGILGIMGRVNKSNITSVRFG